MAELNKCPFCGSGVEKIKVGSPFMWEHAIECADCGASTKLMGGITPSIARDRVIKAWNNRVTEAEIRAMAKAEAIDEFAEKLHEREFDNVYGTNIVLTPKEVDEIAEQLKGELGMGRTYEETLDLMSDFANGNVVLNQLRDSDLSNIIVALEKHIAKSPIRKPNADMTHEEVTCPACGAFISLHEHHCKCGQRLSWEVADENN